MKSSWCLLACIPFLLVSCSSIRRVSFTNFEKVQLSLEETGNLHCVLKGKPLHYSLTDRKVHVNHSIKPGSTPYASYGYEAQENIVVPRGAEGTCVHLIGDQILIDFGKGVQIPFMVTSFDTRPQFRINLNERAYSLERRSRKSTLYFYTRNLQKPD